MTDANPQNQHNAEPAPPNQAAGRRGWLKDAFRNWRASWQKDDPATPSADQDEPEASEPQAPEPPPQSDSLRVRMLHNVTERLRGAADSYIAAKLDEIEARVDTKLDHIEGRVDHKMLELHRHITRLRDRELKHRLKILKITLAFTVAVAILSLIYKWVSSAWFGA